MSRKAILFDLDGTLTDSGEGIINCAILALEHFGLPVPSREDLRVFVGPPLRDSFINHGVPADKAEEAIAVYSANHVTTLSDAQTTYLFNATPETELTIRIVDGCTRSAKIYNCMGEAIVDIDFSAAKLQSITVPPSGYAVITKSLKI